MPLQQSTSSEIEQLYMSMSEPEHLSAAAAPLYTIQTSDDDVARSASLTALLNAEVSDSSPGNIGLHTSLNEPKGKNQSSGAKAGYKSSIV